MSADKVMNKILQQLLHQLFKYLSQLQDHLKNLLLVSSLPRQTMFFLKIFVINHCQTPHTQTLSTLILIIEIKRKRFL